MAITKTVPLLMLVNELDRLKEKSGVGDVEAAKHLGCATTKIHRIMTMTSKPRPGDVSLLAEIYGAGPDLARVLLDLARNLGKKGDWSSYEGIYSESLRLRLDLERSSTTIRQHQTEIVPGILQCESYMRAVHEAPTPAATKANVDDVVKARLDRQSVLTQPDQPPKVSFVLSESCLRRTYGEASVMSEQMQYLLKVGKRPNVQLQVLPFDNTSPVTYVAMNFALLHVPGPGIAAPLDFAYVEQYDDSRYLDGHDQVAAYEQLWGYLQAAALGPVESADFIGKVADEYESTSPERKST